MNSNDEQKDFTARVDNLLRRKEFQEAAELLRKALKEMPHDSSPRKDSPKECQYAFWDTEEFIAFVDHYGRKKSVRWVTPSYSKAYYQLAYIAVERGDYDEALTAINRGLALEPDHPLMLCEKGLILGHHNRYEEAINVYQEAIHARPWASSSVKAQALRGQGIALIELEQLDEAEKVFKESLLLDPDSEVARNELDYIKKLREERKRSPSSGRKGDIVLTTKEDEGIDIYGDDLGFEEIVYEDMPGHTRDAGSGEGNAAPEIEELRAAAAKAFAEAEELQTYAEGDLHLDESARFQEPGTDKPLGKALLKYKEALRLWRAAGDRHEEAKTLYHLGMAYIGFGEVRLMMDHFNQAMRIWHELGHHREQALVLYKMGMLFDAVRMKREALSYYKQALTLNRKVNDTSGEVATLYKMSGVYSELGELEESLKHYKRMLVLCQKTGDWQGEAAALNGLAHAYESLGRMEKARVCFEDALAIYQDHADRKNIAVLLRQIGTFYFSLSEIPLAQAYLEQALELCPQLSDRREEAAIFLGLGEVHNMLGEWHTALHYFEQAHIIQQEVGDRIGEALTLNNIGGTYYRLGEEQHALDILKQALNLFRQLKDTEGEATVLNSIGVIYYTKGDKRKALEYYEQSLKPVYVTEVLVNRGGKWQIVSYAETFLEGIK